MRSTFAVILALLFVWNSLLGAMGELVLCLHADGEAHVELAGKAAPKKETCCDQHEEITIAPADCPPCTDLTLESVDLESIRPNEFESIPVEMADMVTESNNFAEPRLRPGVDHVFAHPTRGPPDVEPASELIRRVVVLRL
jgi:hypothetical protein